MRAREVRDLGHLGGEVVAGVTDWAERLQGVVAARAFGALGGFGRPAWAAHDALSGRAYEAVRAASGAAGETGGAVLARLAGGSPLAGSPAGGQLVAALNAVLGDRLDEQESSLALPMTLRNAGKDVTVDRAGVETAFPDATGRLALFVHGLAETDLGWLGRDGHDRPWSYAHALGQNGWTGAAVRYNTGRHISASGASLACLLDDVVEAWPVPLTDIALIGHSMGGLVIRAACTPAAQADHSWLELVRSCVYLGSPHDGAALEQGVNVLGRVLSGVAEAGPLATVLRFRSAGIQDMRYGVFTADAEEGEVDEVVTGADAELAFLTTARHHLVAAHVGRSAEDPLARAVGDWMVRPGSALGLGGRGGRLDPADRMTLPGTNHFGLLKDPRVADKLLEWLP